MPAITLSLARIAARILPLAVVASFTCSAAQLVVNSETPLNVTTPPGFTYVVTDTSGALTVPTDGFLFCANIVDGGGDAATPVTVVPQHGGWMLPIAQDVRTVGYSAGSLVVNRNIMSTLTCRSVGQQGEIASALSEGIFTDGLDPKVTEQFTKLVNWTAPAGFNWAAPNWAIVPTDPCNPSQNQPAQVDEDVACAAVTGVRPGAASGVTVRSGTLLTGTDASNFFYVARVDARYGAQEAGQNGMRAPTIGAPTSGSLATLTLTDGYDRGALGVGGGYLGDTGTWCVLTEVPTTLSLSMCNGAPWVDTLTGSLSTEIPLSLFPDGSHTSFYAAFIRPIVGAPPATSQPVVAVSLLLEQSVTAEGGNRFRGDDIAFGFLPGSPGFPWMSGQ
jgi:hypothetical protein